MFRSHSGHPRGARIFLIKVTDFKIFLNVKSWCGDAAA